MAIWTFIRSFAARRVLETGRRPLAIRQPVAPWARRASHTLSTPWLLGISTLAVLVAGPTVSLHAQSTPTPPLFDNLGDHHWDVTTASDEAQAYFDQGLRLYYAFNHEEAARAFAHARVLDPSCAMCAWGEAMTYGPNINLPMTDEAWGQAVRALHAAQAALDDETAAERALIEATRARFLPMAVEPGADRAAQDRAWIDALAPLVERWPGNHELAVLWGEAVMTARPWDYWTEEGEPREGIAEALARFERVIEADPKHPGACHFYIHAVEKLYPERGVACAERLASLMPGAGHLVHMPGHIYIRVGRYNDAIRVNEHAVHADATYIQDARPGMGVYVGGYVPHNYDFLAFAAAMSGRSEQTLEAAYAVREGVPTDMLMSGELPFLQNFLARPWQFLVRFGRWDAMLAEEAPSEALPHARFMYHYARGRALIGTGRIDEARAELEALRGVRASGNLDDLGMEFNASTDLAAIADGVLAGWLHMAEGETEQALAAFRSAVATEDSLLYGEPPEWSISARHDLGAALLRLELYEEAAETYRRDLEVFRENGWALIGLASALEAQGRSAEAAEARARFDRAWAEADRPIDGSVIDPLGR